MNFDCLSLCEPLARGVQAAGYHTATAIQQQAIPPILSACDLVGCAQTGTGKTAAFAIPTLQRLMTAPVPPTGAGKRRQRSGSRAIRGLIVAPTRELAAQIGESLAKYGRFTGLRHTVIYGGVRQGPQVRALQAGVDILVATPGRLLDLIGQGFVKLAAVEILILDEADQMLDMGFIHDLRKIVAQVPAERQTLMFSATMPPEIRKLASQWLRRPVEVHVAPAATTPELVSQAVYFVEKHHKGATLTKLLQGTDLAKTLVFSRTKRGADKIAKCLVRDGIRAVAIHGDKSQARRQAVIREFNSKRPPVLVATDVAARGLDFTDVSHVINYDLPEVPETYVHRIGRTARAGASGAAVSFCDRDERQHLRMIERLTGQRVRVVTLPATSTHVATPVAVHQETVEATCSVTDPGHQNAAQTVKPRRPRRRAGRNSGQAPATAAGSTTRTSRNRPGKAERRRRKLGA